MKPRIDWAKAPIVFVPVVIPSCPQCTADEFNHVRGEANGDRSSTERVVCCRCNTPYKIVRESILPDSGNHEAASQ